MKTLYKVQEAYANKEYDVDLDFPRLNRYKEFHVFDEEKSVKWNREEVERQERLILALSVIYAKIYKDTVKWHKEHDIKQSDNIITNINTTRIKNYSDEKAWY